jgi:hypothetical protein
MEMTTLFLNRTWILPTTTFRIPNLYFVLEMASIIFYVIV